VSKDERSAYLGEIRRERALGDVVALDAKTVRAMTRAATAIVGRSTGADPTNQK
jgi:hypothetical protein